MRFADAGPRTWLLATVAAWGLLAWVLSLSGMGGRIARLPEDPALVHKLPTPAKVRAERIGPLAQYAEVGTRPLFSEDRRPQPFSLQPAGEGEPAQAFDFILTSVLRTPTFQMAIVQPSAGGDSIRMKIDETPAEAQGWRLVSLEPRAATFEGPQGQKRLELRTYDGVTGTPPTAPRATPTAVLNPVQPAPAPEPDSDAATPPPPTPDASGKPPTVGSTLPDAPMTPEAQMEAIRKRIEARRAQLRSEAQQQQQTTPARK